MYTFSDNEEKLLYSRYAIGAIVIILTGIYSLSEGSPREVMAFLPVYFLTFALLRRFLAHDSRSGIGKTISKRILFTLALSAGVFAVSLFNGSVQPQEMGSLLNMQVTCALLWIIGILGIYDDWRASRLSIAQPLCLGAIGWAFYLLLWMISTGNT
jgi:hypothetical protein